VQRSRCWATRGIWLGRTSRAAEAARAAQRVPSRLILQLREGIDVCLACRVSRGDRLGTLAPGSDLDALVRRFGVKRARPLVPSAPGALTTEPRATAVARAARAGGRRVPHAGVGAAAWSPPDLSRTWVLELRRHRWRAAPP
jgi:hypothetical protein